MSVNLPPKQQRSNADLSLFSNISTSSNKITIKDVKDEKLAIVVRIKGVCSVSPKKRAILKNLRLDRLFSATFVKLNEATIPMLQKVENYIAWGYPTKETVEALLRERGALRVEGKRFKLLNNEQIKIVFEQENIKDFDELVNAIMEVGNNFSTVNRKLWKFCLSAPKGGMKAKKIHFVDGGVHGNREELINEFIEKMI